MVEVIGVVTFVALSWVLAVMMATESDAERRRLQDPTEVSMKGELRGTKASRHAA